MIASSEVKLCFEESFVVHLGRFVDKYFKIVHHICQLLDSTRVMTFFQFMFVGECISCVVEGITLCEMSEIV
jgi:hypothetical protein